MSTTNEPDLTQLLSAIKLLVTFEGKNITLRTDLPDPNK